MRRLDQVTGWVLLFAIAIVSLVPPELRLETNFPHDLEHSRIFFRWLRLGRRLPKQLSRLAFGPNGFLVGDRSRAAFDTWAARSVARLRRGYRVDRCRIGYRHEAGSL